MLIPSDHFSGTRPCSRESILRAIKAAPKLQEIDESSVARIGDDCVVKYGREVRMCEARNMMFAASIPGVLVPEVYDAWETEDDFQSDGVVLKTGFIVMQYIPGKTLKAAWASLSQETRARIYQQLSSSIGALHHQRLHQPGPVGGGPSQGYLFTDYDAGPFGNIDDMEAWFNVRQRVCKDCGRVREEERDFSGDFGELVFCHFDLHLRNFILDPEEKVWIIDWGRAGGYPIYFEETQLEAVPDPGDPYFTDQLLKLISTQAYEKQVERLRGLAFALTTGAFLQPRGSENVPSHLPPPPPPTDIKWARLA